LLSAILLRVCRGGGLLMIPEVGPSLDATFLLRGDLDVGRLVLRLWASLLPAILLLVLRGT